MEPLEVFMNFGGLRKLITEFCASRGTVGSWQMQFPALPAVQASEGGGPPNHLYPAVTLAKEGHR